MDAILTSQRLFYSSVSFVNVLPVMCPHVWHSKKAAYIARNDYIIAMSQMAQVSTEMLEELPSIFRNFRGYFLVFEALHSRLPIPVFLTPKTRSCQDSRGFLFFSCFFFSKEFLHRNVVLEGS